MTIRHTVDSITSDALDALYEQLDAAEASEAQRQLATAREALASATTRAARAEAAIARVRAALPPYDMPVHGDTSRGMQLGWDRARQAALDALDEPDPLTDHGGRTVCTCTFDFRCGCGTSFHYRPEQPGPAPAATQATGPREHCGQLSPETLLTTPRTECVLRPGHTGSHADDVGCRWWPITEEPS